jgi:membrane-associated phospholipid phosphatase
MKKLLVSMAVVMSCAVVNGQIDTTRKPQDTIPTVLDSLHARDSVVTISLSDTLQLHAGDTRQKPVRKGSVYKIKPAIDLPIIAAGTAWSLYGFSQIYSKPSSSEEEILSLNKNNVNSFDRGATNNYSPSADKASDYMFYGSMPVPLLLMMFDGKVRQDFGNVLLVWWETMSVTGIYYTGSAYLFDRYRPLAYNPEAPMHERTDGNAKNSFLGGHPALVGSCMFFTAKVYSDYHPESNAKWVFYTVATGATATTALLRLKAGKHFPTDLLVGSIMGPLTGILVPHFHKRKIFKDPHLSITPYTGSSHGLIARYKF